MTALLWGLVGGAVGALPALVLLWWLDRRAEQAHQRWRKDHP